MDFSNKENCIYIFEKKNVLSRKSNPGSLIVTFRYSFWFSKHRSFSSLLLNECAPKSEIEFVAQYLLNICMNLLYVIGS